MTDTSDLVEQLKQRGTWSDGGKVWEQDALCVAAATALEAKDKEIEALRERVKGTEGDPESSELPTWPELAGYWKARAETAERERDQAREALKQIKTVCEDNADVEHKDLALRFVHNAAARAVIEQGE